MKVFEAEISFSSANFFYDLDINKRKLDYLNEKLRKLSGIIEPKEEPKNLFDLMSEQKENRQH